MPNPSLPSTLVPQQRVPSLQLPTLGHGSFSLADDAAFITLNPNAKVPVIFKRAARCSRRTKDSTADLQAAHMKVVV